jgi:hypothetical protein
MDPPPLECEFAKETIMHKCKILAAALAALAALLLLGPATAQDPLGDYIVLSWNDLGMHCMNQDHSQLSILPPYNNLQAQIIERGDAAGYLPRLVGDGVSLEYSIPGNTYSVGKTNFWSYEDQLFGVNLPDNIGLTGHGLTGNFVYHGPDWIADGIPVTPFTDAAPAVEDPYQQALVILRDAQGTELHRSWPVIPVSTEINCVSTGCHSSITDILYEHEMEDGFDPANQPILCAQCHGSTPLTGPFPGTAGWFSRRIHHRHDFIDETLPGLAGCEKCHPGPTAHCLRDVMSTQYGMICQDCHGNMAQMANSIQTGRIPWLDEPACGSCHMAQFAEPAGVLYRNATGHGGVMCSACHHSPHAIWPSRLPRDNANAIALQGHAGTLSDCSVCHGLTPTGPGPHGFTPSDVVDLELMAGDRLAIYPSPLARGVQATIRASRAGAEGGRLLVFDAQGRLVRLLAARIAGNEVTAQWDGRTGQGEQAPAGVYFVQWRDERGSASGKLVLLD